MIQDKVRQKRLGSCEKGKGGRSSRLVENGRTQQTRVGNSLSTITSLSSGVVQDTVIGPLLFVILINDITHLCIGLTNNCACNFYADDLKL